MSVVVACLSIVAFAYMLRRVQFMSLWREMIAFTRTSIGKLSDPANNDDEKERVARKAAIFMFGCFGKMIFRNILALTPPAILIAAAVGARLSNVGAMEQAFISWPTLLFGIAIFAYEFLVRR